MLRVAEEANSRKSASRIAPVNHLWASPAETSSLGVFSCLPEATEATSVRQPWPSHNAQPRCPPGYPQEPFANPPASRDGPRELGAPGGAPPKGAGDGPSCAPRRPRARGRLRVRRASSKPPPWPGNRVRSWWCAPFLRVLYHTECKSVGAGLLPSQRGGAKGRGIVKSCGSAPDHAATFSSLPSTSSPFLNFAPALTNATR